MAEGRIVKPRLWLTCIDLFESPCDARHHPFTYVGSRLIECRAAANTLRNPSDVVLFRQQMQERHSLESSHRAAVIYDIETDLASRLENCASRRLKRKFRESNLFRT